jgi:predicted glycoside hydrolase/deacetylase ChbG (UPF0249 family)
VQTGRAHQADLLKEWGEQIRRVVDAGIKPTHLDGLGHCHMVPEAAPVLVELAKKHGIPAARLPAERMNLLHSASPHYFKRYAANIDLRMACSRSEAQWDSALICPDAFFGFAEGGRLTAEAVRRMGLRLQGGVSELMAHPGLLAHDPVLPIDYYWAGDRAALTAYTKEAFASTFNVELVSYRDAWE